MAIVEWGFCATFSCRSVSPAHHLCQHLARLPSVKLFCSELTCSHCQQAETEADVETEVKEEKRLPFIPFRPSQCKLHHQASTGNGHKKVKISHEQRNARLYEEDDDRFMQEALREAQKAAAIGEVPVGAVLVSERRIIARAHNRVEKQKDPTAHAEMICIRSTARHLGGWRLLNSTLYVTLEPCPMCAGALLQARVGNVVWGARNPLLGADGSWVSLFPSQPSTYTAEELRCSCGANGAAQERNLIHPFNCDIKVRGGVLAKECSEILKAFFRKRRRESKESTPNYFDFPSLLFLIRKAFHMVVSIFKFLHLH